MVGNRFTRGLRIAAIASLLVTVVAAAAPAYAKPSSASFKKQLAAKQAQVDDIEAKLDELDDQAEIISEEYNQASVRLEQVTAQVDDAQNQLNATRAALTTQNEILSNRVANIYRDGNLTAFEVLLDSKSVSDFIGRVRYLNAVSKADANKAADLKSQKKTAETQLATLQTAQAQAEELAFQLKAKQAELELSAKDQQALLDSVNRDVAELIAEQAATRSSKQQALLSGVLAGRGKTGIVATPGTPVETALAYCGVPYLWGGASPSAFDCSGLVLYVFAQHGVTLPHYSGWQFQRGEKVALSAIQPNDVVFFGSPVHHVGIYAGGGYFIHAPKRNDVVKISKLSERNDIAGVRRYPWTVRTEPIKH